MAIFNPPFQLQNPESEEHAKYVLEVASKPNFDFPSVSNIGMLIAV